MRTRQSLIALVVAVAVAFTGIVQTGTAAASGNGNGGDTPVHADAAKKKSKKKKKKRKKKRKKRGSTKRQQGGNPGGNNGGGQPQGGGKSAVQEAVEMLAGKRLHTYQGSTINTEFSNDRWFDFCSNGTGFYEQLYTTSSDTNQFTSTGTWKVTEAQIGPNREWAGARVQVIDNQGQTFMHEIYVDGRGVRMNGMPAEVTNSQKCS